MSAPARRVRLKRVSAPSADTRHLVFEVTDAKPFDFEPGQYVCLSKTLNGQRVERHYSIASAPDIRGRFELCVKPVGDGSPFGNFLAQVTPGEEFECRGPDGTFRLVEPLRDTIFLAAGTGITPFRAMLRHLLAGPHDRSGGRAITLIFGARRPEGLYFRSEFEQLESERPNFRFQPTVSGLATGWTGRRGHVQHHLEEVLGNGHDATDVYLCGPKAMVNEVRAELTASGFDERAIHYEKYE